MLLELKFENFIEDHFANDPKLLQDVKALEAKHKLKLLFKLYEDKNEINFYSWISEMRFGIYFDTFCSELKYNEKIEGKTPDWTFTINRQRIITDVLRINTEESELKEQIENLKKIRKFQKENTGERLVMHSRTKVMSSAYLYGAQSKLVAKEIKYRDIIVTKKVPLIVCVACTLDTYLDSLDFFDFLIGHSKRGFFYTDSNFGNNVTGILIRTYYGEFTYFHNELAENKLSSKNSDHFDKIIYKEHK